MAEDTPESGLPRKDHPDVVVHPPVLIAIVLVAALAIQWVWPLDPVAAFGSLAGRPLGGLLFAAGLGLAIWAVLAFRRAGTNVPTFQPTLALVERGPYGHTRNPIYVSLILAMIGLALLIGNAWLLLAAVPFALIVHFGVVKREESYLRGLFGAAYDDYCKRVPRWTGF